MNRYHDPYSPYEKYTGRSAGRVLHFIYHYCGSNIAEHATVNMVRDNFRVTLHHGASASFIWEGYTPLFTFTGDDPVSLAYYEKRQKQLRDYLEKSPKSIEHVDKLVSDFSDWLRELPSGEEMKVMPREVYNAWINTIHNLPTNDIKNFFQMLKIYKGAKDNA